MLTPAQTDQIDILLVAPRNPLNIGAAARAMANFGFRRLSIVAPFALNWMEAKSAVGAPDLLREAQVFATLAEAVAPCHLVLGTGSLDRRKPVQEVLSLPQAAAQVRIILGEPGQPGSQTQHSEAARLGSGTSTRSPARIALLFGSEKHGLTAEELSWCHAIVVIDTAEAQPSMNLGQAVAVCLYELSRDDLACNPGPPGPSPDRRETQTEAIANAEQLDRLAALVEQTMAAVNYSTRGMRSANGEALRILLRRLMPTDPDLRRVMGLFRRILWQLEHRRAKP